MATANYSAVVGSVNGGVLMGPWTLRPYSLAVLAEDFAKL